MLVGFSLVCEKVSISLSEPQEGLERLSKEEAFDSFLAESYSKLVGAAFLIVRDRGVAEDIVQETFARAYLRWGKLWPDGNPGGWTYRVSVNLAKSWRRKLAAEARAFARLGRVEVSPSPEELVDPDLMKAMQKLPSRQRQAVALHYVLGLPLEEVAHAMGCRIGTVKSCLHSARAKIRRELGEP